MATLGNTLGPVRKSVGAGLAAVLTTAFAVLNADNFDLHRVTVSQWESVALAVFGGSTFVYGLRNKGGKAADVAAAAPDAPADAAAPAVDAPASNVAPAAPPAIAEDVLNAIAADWAAATAPAETPPAEVPASPSV